MQENNDVISLNSITQEISNMYTLSTRQIDTTYMKKNTKQKPKRAQKKWYNQDCDKMRKKLNQIRKLVDKNPNKT